jgi:hypothetical protein
LPLVPERVTAPRRGRPRKFLQPSRAVTLTLPEDVIAVLTKVDDDLSRAVVRLAQAEIGKEPHPPAELASFGRRAVIVVNPTRTLEQRTGVTLVPLSDGRALIAFDESMTPARFELRIEDELEHHDLPEKDARIFESIRDLLREARRSKTVVLRRPNIIVLEHVHHTSGRKAHTDGHRKGD